MYVILKSTESLQEARNVNVQYVHIVLYVVLHREKHCLLKQCHTGLCCCSVQMILVPGETHTATVGEKRGKKIESKNISVTDTSRFTNLKWKYINLQLPKIDCSRARIKVTGLGVGWRLRNFPLTYLSSTTVKPQTPTIISVNESNGNFEVRWKTNMESLCGNRLKACVTYHKKGDTEKVGLT